MYAWGRTGQPSSAIVEHAVSRRERYDSLSCRAAYTKCYSLQSSIVVLGTVCRRRGAVRRVAARPGRPDAFRRRLRPANTAEGATNNALKGDHLSSPLNVPKYSLHIQPRCTSHWQIHAVVSLIPKKWVLMPRKWFSLIYCQDIIFLATRFF